MKLLQYPRVLTPFGFTKDTLWLRIKIFSVKKISMDVVGGSSYIQKDKDIMEFRILSPNDISENITHDWEDAENMVSRMKEIGARYGRAGDEIGRAVTAYKNGASLSNINAMSKHKVDNPLIYKGSNRREISLMFQLADQGDNYNDVVVPADLFKQYSSAEVDTDYTIKYPYICSVKSEGSGFFNFDNMAIVAVQPQYSGPYRNGYPSKCELQVTFRDLSPLYRSSWTHGSAQKVTTNKV